MDIAYGRDLIYREIQCIDVIADNWTDSLGIGCCKALREINEQLIQQQQKKEVFAEQIKQILRFCEDITGGETPSKKIYTR